MNPERRRLYVVIAVLGLADLALLVALLLPGAPSAGAEDSLRVLERAGLSAALESLERSAATDSAVLRDGHQLAHALGRRAVLSADGDPSVIRDCRPSFASGCYHGVVEAFVQRHGRVEMGTLERMCLSAGSREHPGPVSECVHGLGHGVLGAVGMDVGRALRYCDELAATAYRAGCHSGVFMEAITSAVGHAGMAHEHHGTGTAHAASVDRRRPYAPCEAYGDPYADSCWLFQGFVILRHTGFDVPAAFRLCDAAPPRRAPRCYEGLGHQLSGLFQRDDDWIVAQCRSGAPTLAAHCATGAVLALTAMDWSGTRAMAFCASAPRAWRAECYGATAQALAALASPRRREELCTQIEAEFAAACRAEQVSEVS